MKHDIREVLQVKQENSEKKKLDFIRKASENNEKKLARSETLQKHNNDATNLLSKSKEIMYDKLIGLEYTDKLITFATRLGKLSKDVVNLVNEAKMWIDRDRMWKEKHGNSAHYALTSNADRYVKKVEEKTEEIQEMYKKIKEQKKQVCFEHLKAFTDSLRRFTENQIRSAKLGKEVRKGIEPYTHLKHTVLNISGNDNLVSKNNDGIDLKGFNSEVKAYRQKIDDLIKIADDDMNSIRNLTVFESQSDSNMFEDAFKQYRVQLMGLQKASKEFSEQFSGAQSLLEKILSPDTLKGAEEQIKALKKGNIAPRYDFTINRVITNLTIEHNNDNPGAYPKIIENSAIDLRAQIDLTEMEQGEFQRVLSDFSDRLLLDNKPPEAIRHKPEYSLERNAIMFSKEEKAVFFDIDGTLAPMVDRAQDARISPEGRKMALEFIKKGYKVAFISGRGYEGDKGVEELLKNSGFSEPEIDSRLD